MRHVPFKQQAEHNGVAQQRQGASPAQQPGHQVARVMRHVGRKVRHLGGVGNVIVSEQEQRLIRKSGVVVRGGGGTSACWLSTQTAPPRTAARTAECPRSTNQRCHSAVTTQRAADALALT